MLGLEGICRLPAGSEPETLRRLLDAAERLSLPPLHRARARVRVRARVKVRVLG